MTSRWFMGLACLIIVLTSGPGWAGGEIPWPLSRQHEMTVQNSQGLWLAWTPSGRRYYNVEIVDGIFGATWMRVSEIDAESQEVISMGENFFFGGSSKCKESKDRGRYLTMFSNGDEKKPHKLRLVELDFEWGSYLGISIYPDVIDDEGDHRVGHRTRRKPVSCEWENTSHFSCDMEKPGNPSNYYKINQLLQ